METDQAPKRLKNKKVRTTVVVCACVCVVALVIAVIATGTPARIVNALRSKMDAVYDLSGDVQKLPVSSLSDDVLAMAETFDLSPSSVAPYVAEQSFSSHEDAVAFIGSQALTPMRWDLPQQKTALTVLGNADGQINMLTLETDYTDGGVHMQAFSVVYTENFQGEIVFDPGTSNAKLHSREKCTSSHGVSYVIVRANEESSGVRLTDAVLVDSGVEYTLHILYDPSPENTAIAEARLHQWAEQFGVQAF